MIQPLTLEEFTVLAKNSKKIAVFQEIPANQLRPIIIYQLLYKKFKSDGVILEDLYKAAEKRYSFICFETIATLTINNNDNKQPLSALRDLQTQNRYTTRATINHLITSAVGFVTYDIVRFFEDIPDSHTADTTLPVLSFNFYALNITFDHDNNTVLVSTIVKIDTDITQAYQQAQQKITTIIEILTTTKTIQPKTQSKTPCLQETATISTDTSDVEFMQMVEMAKNYIIRGDAFQIVISRCFQRQYSVTPLKIYESLCKVSPSPFMFYLPTATNVIIGASPERFIRVHNKQITINPIAGTRKRQNKQDDTNISNSLLNDPKEMAEHMMLVDLARNDIGMVSAPGSVRVNELTKIKHYSHVSHITSTINGTLQQPYDALNAFTAAFPAGTVSGAPKIRAMQIIDKLEKSRRGLYGGAICRLDTVGDLESCLAIRMAILQNGTATIRTGAGIVYDSNPATESNETYQKASSVLDAIARAQNEKPGASICY